MQKSKSAFLLLTVCTVSFLSLQAQLTDSIVHTGNLPDTVKRISSWQIPAHRAAFNIKNYVIPAMMIIYGITAIENDGLQNLNKEINEEIWTDRVHKPLHIDNYLQFAPAAAVYGLNAAGIKGKHNFRDRSMIYLLSNIMLNGMVYSTKKISHQLRPDNSAYSSFPSGHTAEAFASAEFMRMEYKDLSPWYGVAGYAMAAATGYLRMYNNRHWFSDVVAGAGVGILSTRLAYWFYPKIQHSLFKDKHPNTMVMPAYQNGAFGMLLAHRFH